MNSSSYSLASTALKRQAARLEAVSSNLSSNTTPGFKRSIVSMQAFDETLNNAKQATAKHPNGAPKCGSVDFSEGGLRFTENTFDFAIKGSGFFVLDDNGNDIYTRNGRFLAGPDGVLVTPSGIPVKGEGGAIRIPENLDRGSFSVTADGTLMAGKETMGKLSIIDFTNPEKLLPTGPALFIASDDVEVKQVPDGSVVNKTLEDSNVSVFEEMAELMSTMRSYEAITKMLKQQDDVHGKLIRYLG